jgi:integrase
MARRRWLPENVTSFRDKCGRTRYRFRKKGFATHLFRCEPGTPGFLEELAKAQCAQPVAKARFAHGTFDALIESYYRSKKWVQLKKSTQQMRYNMVENFRRQYGSHPVDRLEARHIDRWMGDKAVNAPHAANHLRKMLNQLMKHAILLGWRSDNPVDIVEPIRISGEGFHCWTDAEIRKYDDKWPIGTRERLAKELLLCTALRKSDMIKLGHNSRIGDRLVLYHTKNDSGTSIQILPQLEAAINAVPGGFSTYLVTQKGKPFTPAGFGNWFRERCDMAGLPNCSAHGLRKAMARRLAEAGATVSEGMAVTGHKTTNMFMHYAAGADKNRLAQNGFGKLDNHTEMANSLTSLPSVDAK